MIDVVREVCSFAPRGRARRSPAVVLALVLCVAAPLRLGAQGGGPIAGTVVRAGSFTPVEGAQVRVQGTTVGAVSDAAGRFRIGEVPGAASGATVTLEVRRLSFQPATQAARVGATDVRVIITETSVRLDEVVVTGTPAGIQQRAVGNTVATISAPQELERSGVGDVGTLINARAAGVIVTPGSGRTGAGPSINVRGRSTISLSQQPLIYIDGVRVANDIGTGPRNQGGAAVSRLNDVSPEDIESIEIIKGPAAATIYGTEASNGVVQIITKRGTTGVPRWNLTTRQGAQWFQDYEGRLPTNYGRDAASGQILSWNAAEQERARGADLFDTGRLQSFGGNVSGGTPAVNYFVSGTYDRDKGIESSNALRRLTGHANVTVRPSERFDVASSLNFVTGRTHLGSDYGFGTLWAASYGSPLTASTPTRGFNIAPPEVARTQFDYTQDVNRFTASVLANHRPAPWFTQRLTVGVDQTAEDNQALSRFLPREYQQFFAAAAGRGSLLQDLRTISYYTGDYSGTAKFGLWGGLSSATSVGGQYYRKRYNTSQVSGREFPAPGLTTAAAAAVREGSQDYFTNTTIGFYAQQVIDWNDRLFLTGAVRVDNNSAFGEDFDLATYPKLSATWVVSEEPFWGIRPVGTLKLRAAYGVSGQQPDAFSALRTFQPVTGTLDQPAVTPQFVGNPDLKPERGVEFEGGFEAALFDERLSLDFTYFNKRTRDAILLQQVAPSLGFPGSQFVNIGEVSNRGVELLARYQALRGERLGLEIGGNLGTAKDRIEDLGGIPFIAVTGLPQRHVEGYPIGALWAKRVVSADVSSAGVPSNILCDPGDAGGAPQPCATAPVVYQGTITPRFTGALSSTLTLGSRLRFYGLVDTKRGHKLLDTDAVLRCAIFRVCEVNVRPENYTPQYLGNVALGSGLQVVDQFIRDASFARLRELSVAYTLPERWARRAGASRANVTLAGRNLYTWTSYPGLDPESRSVISGIGAFDQALTPTLAQIVTTIGLTF